MRRPETLLVGRGAKNNINSFRFKKSLLINNQMTGIEEASSRLTRIRKQTRAKKRKKRRTICKTAKNRTSSLSRDSSHSPHHSLIHNTRQSHTQSHTATDRRIARQELRSESVPRLTSSLNFLMLSPFFPMMLPTSCECDKYKERRVRI